MIDRQFFSVLTDDLSATRDWYVGLFGYTVAFDSDWFVHLHAPDHRSLELGAILRTHEIIPQRFRAAPAGGLLTIVVDDVDAAHTQVLAAGAEIIEAPRNLFYGQRRMLLQDPNWQLVDVSSECTPDPEWLAGIMGNSPPT